jgi:microcystin-dependent protein
MGSSLYLQGGAATQNTLKDTLIQSGHGFTVGSAIRYNTNTSQWTTARANNAENSEVVGVVSAVLDVDTFTVVYSGVIDIPSLAGVSYPALFLSDTVPGGITHSPPSVIGSVVKPVIVRSASSNGGYVVVNYLGTQIGGSSTVSIDQIQPVGTIMPYAGTAIPDTWLECNAQPVGVTVYPELYDKTLHGTLPRAPIYGHRVKFTGTGLGTFSIAPGDIVQYKTNSNAWSGTVWDSNAAIIGRVVSLSSTTTINQANTQMVVETLPIYDSTKKTFYFPNAVFGAGSGAATQTATTANSFRIWNPANSVYRDVGTNFSVATTEITDFLTPNLQGKFPLGTNDVADADTLTPSGSGFYNAASARTIGDLGGQEETIAGTQVGTSTTSGLFATTVSSGLREQNMPPFLATKYIIKAKPYTRAAIIDDVDINYPTLLVGDLRSGIMRGAGVGEDLVFKTNTSLSTNGTERMRLSNAGYLGIGTTDSAYTTHTGSSIPKYPLEVVGQSAQGGVLECARFINTAASTSSVRILLGSNTNPSGGAATQASITAKTTSAGAGTLEFGTSGNTQRIVIDGVGNVGIGTNAPTAQLMIQGADGTKQGLFVNLSGTDAASLANTMTEMWTRAPVHIKAAGTSTPRVLIGGVLGGSSAIQTSTSSYGPVSMCIQPFGGNVAIGKTAASSALDVVGAISASSSITTATSFIGNGTIPIGGIIMWSGSTVPTGWALCDGRTVSGQTTPDLRGRFIVGINTTSITVPSDQAAATVSGSQPTYNRAAVGGSTASTVPPHSHTMESQVYQNINFFGSSQGPIHGFVLSASTNNGVSVGTNRYRLKTSTPVDSASGGENRPPYYALAFIMRVA